MIYLIPEGWGIARPVDVYEVLSSVHNCFSQYFREQINNNPVIVINAGNIGHPVCYKSYAIIFLDVLDRFWCRYVYQFAHEYCHYQIRRDVIQPMRWFEESICELSSLFFLLRVDELWATEPPYPNWMNYHDEFTSYALNEAKTYEEFNTDFSLENSDVLNYLKSYEYDRPKNMYVARKFLPIFEAHPFLWQAVPFLADLTEGLAFAESMKEWALAAPPICWEGISEIAHVFNVDI